MVWTNRTASWRSARSLSTSSRSPEAIRSRQLETTVERAVEGRLLAERLIVEVAKRERTPLVVIVPADGRVEAADQAVPDDEPVALGHFDEPARLGDAVVIRLEVLDLHVI